MKIMEETAKIVSAVAVAIFLVTANLVVSYSLFFSSSLMTYGD